MLIDVVGAESISAQARTYAEYRVFAALTRMAGLEPIRRASILLRDKPDRRGCPRVSCAVTVVFDDAAAVRVRATGSHAYEAINRAVDRLESLERGRHSRNISRRICLNGRSP
jgi:ribosome-associated translation inhibitor RaiA